MGPVPTDALAIAPDAAFPDYERHRPGNTSCGGRKMAETAAFLVDQIFPKIPVRRRKTGKLAVIEEEDGEKHRSMGKNGLQKLLLSPRNQEMLGLRSRHVTFLGYAEVKKMGYIFTRLAICQLNKLADFL